MLANAPNGKVSEALAQIYAKEDISLEQGKDFTPTVYVAKVSCCSVTQARKTCVIFGVAFHKGSRGSANILRVVPLVTSPNPDQ